MAVDIAGDAGALRQRIATTTTLGGWQQLPDGFDLAEGDWQTVLSDSPFERLYLDVNQATTITSSLVKQHFDLLADFWTKKLAAMSQGANREQIVRKFGIPDASEAKIRTYPARLREARDRLDTPDHIQIEAAAHHAARRAKAQVSLEGLISAVLIDGVLDPAEAKIVFLRGLAAGLREEEAQDLLLERLKEAGFVRAPDHGGTDGVFAVQWLSRDRQATAPASLPSYATEKSERTAEADAYAAEGAQYYKLRELANAVLSYTRAIEAAPTRAESYLGRGNALHAQKKYEEAIADYTKASELDRTEPVYYLNRANAKRMLDDTTGALADYTRVVALRPDYVEGYRQRAEVYRTLKRNSDAVDDLTRAIDASGGSGSLYNSRGIYRDELGDHFGAIADYALAITAVPTNAVYYNNRGDSKRLANDPGGAIEDHSKAIDLKADYDLAFFQRGLAREALHDQTGAEKDYTRALQLLPKSPLYLRARGICRYTGGDFRGAIADLDAALTHRRNDAVGLYVRGEVKRRTGDVAGASADLAEAKRLGVDLSAVPSVLIPTEPSSLDGPAQAAPRRSTALFAVAGVVAAAAVTIAAIAFWQQTPTVPGRAPSAVGVIGYGNLEVAIDQPANATLDDWHLPDGGQRPSQTHSFSHVEEGSHSLDVWSPGHHRQSITVNVARGDTKRVRVKLQ